MLNLGFLSEDFLKVCFMSLIVSFNIYRLRKKCQRTRLRYKSLSKKRLNYVIKKLFGASFYLSQDVADGVITHSIDNTVRVCYYSVVQQLYFYC